MTWIKLDDDFTENEKFLRAGPLAGYLHICAIAWSRHNLTDGVIPRYQPSRLVAWEPCSDDLHQDFRPTELVTTLVRVGLWHLRDDGDYEIHDYLKHQDSKAKVESERAKLAQRQKKWRERQASKNGSAEPDAEANGARNAVTNGGITPPVTLLESREGRTENAVG